MTDRTGELTQLAHKIAFLANEFPQKKFKEVSEMITVPILDFNTALEMAKEFSFFSIDPKKDKAIIDQLPKEWNFGSEVDKLEDATLYILKKWAEHESDMHEEYYLNMVYGYTTHDIIVAGKHLLNQGLIVEYNLENVTKADKKGEKDTIDNYVFWTLKENSGKRWGEKQFKDTKRVK